MWKSAKFGLALTIEGRQDIWNEQPNSKPKKKTKTHVQDFRLSERPSFKCYAFQYMPILQNI
jgi:hypothetical protein